MKVLINNCSIIILEIDTFYTVWYTLIHGAK